MRILLVLVGIWLVAAGVVWFARAAKPTPASIERYITTHPLDQKSDLQRRDIIAKVAAQMNRLSFEERRAFRQQDGIDHFFNSLTPEERGRFLDLTLPEGFRQLMQALNKMKPEQRKKIVERALAAMESNETGPDNRRRPIDSQQEQKIINQGMSAFYEQASAEVKLDFAPLIEQMQRSLQHTE